MRGRALALLLLAPLLVAIPVLLGTFFGAMPGSISGPGAAPAQTVAVAAREGRRNLAYNLANQGDWGTQQPFIDVMRFARPWEGHMRGQWGGVSEADLIDGGYLSHPGR